MSRCAQQSVQWCLLLETTRIKWRRKVEEKNEFGTKKSPIVIYHVFVEKTHVSPARRPVLCGDNLSLRVRAEPGRQTHVAAFSYGFTQCYLPPDTGERAPP